jgi:hypothetical protein
LLNPYSTPEDHYLCLRVVYKVKLSICIDKPVNMFIMFEHFAKQNINLL